MATLDIEILSRLRAFALELKLSVGDGEVLALAGPSGAGKTTVLRCVAGLRRPDGGRIAVRRADVVRARDGRPPAAAPVGRLRARSTSRCSRTSPSGATWRSPAPTRGPSRRCSSASGSRPSPTSRPTGSAVANASARRSRARSPAARASCCSTSRSPRSTRRPGASCATSSPTSCGAWRSRRCWSRTTSATPPRSVDRVAIIVDGRIRQVGTPAELTAAPADAFVVAFTGGSVLSGTGRGRHGRARRRRCRWRSTEPVSGPVDVGVYPWEVEVRRGPGPDGALRGTRLQGRPSRAGRVRVRVGELDRRGAGSADGLEPGVEAHGIPARAHVLARRTISP